MASDTFAQALAIGAIDKATTNESSISNLNTRVTQIEANGVRYKGVVNYYDQLPTTGAKIGDLYTIKYQGTAAEAQTALWGAEYVCARIENNVCYYEEIGLATQATIVSNNLVLGQAVGTVVGNSLVM